MRTPRKEPRRSFTVEVKSGERGGTIIPSRVAPLAKPTPQLFLPSKPEPPPAIEKRRILPNLSAREAEPVADEAPQPRKRGRPRKVQAAPAEPITTVQETAPLAPPVASVPWVPAARTAPRKPAVRPGAPFPAGDRWKRRLGRWSR